jgi:hypothetical protein
MQIFIVMKFVFVSFFLMSLGSCNWFYSTISGIKNSRFETEYYQKKYLVSKSVDTSYLAYFNRKFYDSLAHPGHSLDTFKNMGYTPIQFRVFDRDGNLFSGWEICFGNPDKAEVYKNFPHKVFSQWPVNNQLKLLNDFNYIIPINFNLDEIKKNILEGQYDYIVISFWAGYLGKHSVRMLKDLDQQIRNSKKILHIKVNLSD